MRRVYPNVRVWPRRMTLAADPEAGPLAMKQFEQDLKSYESLKKQKGAVARDPGF